MRTAVKIIVIFLSISFVALAGTFIYKIALDNHTKQLCMKWENDILAGQSHETPATLAFQASDFNAKCSDFVGPGNELTVSSPQ